jgi:hypothetical protein
MQTTVSKNAERRRHSNRNANCRNDRRDANNLYRQPQHIGIFLNRILDENRKTDREKIVKLFNT